MKREEKVKGAVKNRKVWKRIVWVLVGLVLVGGIVGGVIWWNLEGSKTALEKRGLPDRGVTVMEIKLKGASSEDINGGDRETKYEGNEASIYENGEVREHNNVQIKGRGNLSWDQPKKSYQIKFTKNVDLFGTGKSKKWVLISNYLDPTFLRNDIALMLADMVGVRFSHRGDFIELYVDDNYNGLYYAVQKIEIAKESVNLRGGDGVLFELDNLHRKEDEHCYETYLEECLIFKDATIKGEENNEKEINGFVDAFNQVEKAAQIGEYGVVNENLDVESFVKYFLVNEFVVNPDGYSTSFYLYRNEEGKIAAGPVWDFDLAFANRVWGESKNENFYSPDETMIRRDEVLGLNGFERDFGSSRLIYYLMDIPGFRERVDEVFQMMLSGRKEEFLNNITRKVDKIKEAIMEDERNWEKAESFENEYDVFIDWIKARYDHLEEVFGDPAFVRKEVI